MSTQEGEAKAKEHDIVFTETSAKNDLNVQNLFRTLASNLTGNDQTTINRSQMRNPADESRIS